mmetsp:Transcript_2704/g.7142  ORF Transcript_2704/g.7142 Transcript_2704/m.7142 type:complete len:203 (+) Transcript_2704:2716-3324(+)
MRIALAFAASEGSHPSESSIVLRGGSGSARIARVAWELRPRQIAGSAATPLSRRSAGMITRSHVPASRVRPACAARCANFTRSRTGVGGAIVVSAASERTSPTTPSIRTSGSVLVWAIGRGGSPDRGAAAAGSMSRPASRARSSRSSVPTSIPASPSLKNGSASSPSPSSSPSSSSSLMPPVGVGGGGSPPATVASSCDDPS